MIKVIKLIKRNLMNRNKKKNSALLVNKKYLINLNYRVNKLILKKGKLSKVSLLLDHIYLSLIKRTKKNAFNVLNQAVKNIMPIFLLKNKKIGKRVIIRPVFILSSYSRRFLGMKSIIETASKKTGDFPENLIIGILEAFYNKGVVKKRQKDLNSIVLENRSNLKYRW
jgi:small subunit ribosomal protein S7